MAANQLRVCQWFITPNRFVNLNNEFLIKLSLWLSCHGNRCYHESSWEYLSPLITVAVHLLGFFCLWTDNPHAGSFYREHRYENTFYWTFTSREDAQCYFQFKFIRANRQWNPNHPINITAVLPMDPDFTSHLQLISEEVWIPALRLA